MTIIAYSMCPYCMSVSRYQSAIVLVHSQTGDAMPRHPYNPQPHVCPSSFSLAPVHPSQRRHPPLTLYVPTTSPAAGSSLDRLGSRVRTEPSGFPSGEREGQSPAELRHTRAAGRCTLTLRRTDSRTALNANSGCHRRVTARPAIASRARSNATCLAITGVRAPTAPILTVGPLLGRRLVHGRASSRATTTLRAAAVPPALI